MRLKDFSILNPVYQGTPLETEVSFVPMESLRYGRIDYQEITFSEAKGKYTFFANGDLLIAKVTPCFENGNIAIANGMKEGIGFGSSEIFVLRMGKSILNTYMFYVVQTSKFRDAACATMCGVGGLKRISPLFMRTYELNVPILADQQRIVDYLDKKTSDIDTEIELLEKKKDAYTRLKKAMINRAVTRGLDEHVKLKDSGVEWIGTIPEHWEVKRIKELCSFVSRGTTPDYVDDGEYKVMNQAVFSTGNLNHKVVRCSSYMKPDSQIKKGDLLIASTGGGVLGKLYFFDDEDTDFYADTHVTIVRNDKGSFYVKFLFYLLSCQFDMINACMAKGSTNQTELQRDSLISYELAIPPLGEQQAIIVYLDMKCAKIDATIANIDKQTDALKRLKRSLINEVITGQRAI
jgi:type I restriction enzyme S subunit